MEENRPDWLPAYPEPTSEQKAVAEREVRARLTAAETAHRTTLDDKIDALIAAKIAQPEHGNG